MEIADATADLRKSMAHDSDLRNEGGGNTWERFRIALRGKNNPRHMLFVDQCGTGKSNGRFSYISNTSDAILWRRSYSSVESKNCCTSLTSINCNPNGKGKARLSNFFSLALSVIDLLISSGGPTDEQKSRRLHTIPFHQKLSIASRKHRPLP